MAERVFVMPDPGEGLEEGRIVEWLVTAGDVVTLNQPLVEVETAKAAVEIPSPYAGTIVALHGEVGDDVPVGSPLLTFEVDGAEPADGVASPGERTGPVKATPPVRRLARELGVDIETVVGTGPDGRVTEPDVRGAAGPGAGSPAADPVRREIAAVLTRQAAIPQVTTFRTVDCTALDAYRRELGVSPLPVMIAALCQVLPRHELLTARWAGDAIEPRADIHVGIAVDTDRGLLVPVVRDAAHRGIGDLNVEVARLADTARAGGPSEGDATFAVSNTGSYGSEAGTPILSPGTSATLAIGVISPRALVVDGEVVARPACTLSLTFDHRVMDGAAAGRFLTDLVALVQSPDGLRDLPR